MEAAKARIEAMQKGDPTAADDVLNMAARAVREAIAGKLPDPEQRVYLEFIARSLEEMRQGTDALALHRVRRVPAERDIALYLAVGQKLDELGTQGHTDSPVKAAISAISRRTQVPVPTVEKIWKRFGGEDAWKLAKEI